MRLSTKASISDSGSEDGDSSSSAATHFLINLLMKNLNTFKGRAILFGIIALALSVLLGFVCPTEAVADGKFVLYGTLATFVASLVYEIVLIFTQKRRPETFTIGGGVFGSIVGGFLVAGLSILFGVIV